MSVLRLLGLASWLFVAFMAGIGLGMLDASAKWSE